MLVTAKDEMSRLLTTNIVTVNSREGDRFRVTRYEASILVGALAVQAHVRHNKHDDFYFRLIVSRQRYYSLLKGVRSPASPSGVTRAHQPANSKRSVPHYDRVKCGIFSRTTSIMTAVQSKGEYTSRLAEVNGLQK